MLTVSLDGDYPHLSMNSFYIIAQGLEYIIAFSFLKKITYKAMWNIISLKEKVCAS